MHNVVYYDKQQTMSWLLFFFLNFYIQCRAAVFNGELGIQV